jgi:hypothetical protein
VIQKLTDEKSKPSNQRRKSKWKRNKNQIGSILTMY